LIESLFSFTTLSYLVDNRCNTQINGGNPILFRENKFSFPVEKQDAWEWVDVDLAVGGQMEDPDDLFDTLAPAHAAQAHRSDLSIYFLNQNNGVWNPFFEIRPHIRVSQSACCKPAETRKLSSSVGT
jgi:hypothetical protein